MKINKTIKPATPWNLPLAKLSSLERTIASSEGEALKARWLFGRELVSRRVAYNGRQVIPRDFMQLTIEQCGISKTEINYRVQFALRYPDKDSLSDAIGHWPSWFQMTHEGLVDKKRAASKKQTDKPAPVSSSAWVIPRLGKELETAYANHPVLTRDQVRDLERLAATITKILEQIDRNDASKAEKAS